MYECGRRGCTADLLDLNVDCYFGEPQELRRELEQLQELLNKLAFDGTLDMIAL